MAEIRPFRGLRYSSKAGALEGLVAPPYDVLSDSEREEYAGRSPHNVVRVTLPEQLPDDRSKYIKYGRSSARLAEWRRDGVLQTDERPCLYRYTQKFSVPASADEYERTSVIALLKTEPYEAGTVLPHEQTFPKHKEDRLRLLEATRAHLESIFGLCEDDGSFLDALKLAPARKLAEVEGADGVGNVVEAIEDEAEIRSLARMLASKRIWIADGHHRYETARGFRESLGAKDGPAAEDYLMMAIGSMADPGLVILPTHRILPKLPVGPARFEQLIQTRFAMRRVPNESLLSELRRLQAEDARVLGVALPGGTGLLLCLDDPDLAVRWTPGPESERLKKLDVTILHHVIFEMLMGIEGTDSLRYTRDADEALAAVRDEGAAAFLINPPTVEDMRVIALGGEKMPQKSTYYFPKLLSGLVLWSLDDFDAR